MKLFNITIKNSDKWFNLYTTDELLKSELEYYLKELKVNREDLIIK